MRAILIDAVNTNIKEIKVDGTLEGIYKALGVDMIEAGGYLPDNHILYVDEEGLLKPIQAIFNMREMGQEVFVGNGLIVKLDDEGNDIDCELTLSYIRSLVKFRV